MVLVLVSAKVHSYDSCCAVGAIKDLQQFRYSVCLSHCEKFHTLRRPLDGQYFHIRNLLAGAFDGY